MANDEYQPRWEYCDKRGEWCDNVFTFTDDAILDELDNWNWDAPVEETTCSDYVTGDASLAIPTGYILGTESHAVADGVQHSSETNRIYATNEVCPSSDVLALNSTPFNAEPYSYDQAACDPHQQDDQSSSYADQQMHSLPIRQPLSDQAPSIDTSQHRNVASDCQSTYLPENTNDSVTQQSQQKAAPYPVNSYAGQQSGRICEDVSYLQSLHNPSNVRSQTMREMVLEKSLPTNAGTSITTMQDLGQAHLRPIPAAHVASEEAEQLEGFRSMLLVPDAFVPDGHLSHIEAHSQQPVHSADLQKSIDEPIASDVGFSINSNRNTLDVPDPAIDFSQRRLSTPHSTPRLPPHQDQQCTSQSMDVGLVTQLTTTNGMSGSPDDASGVALESSPQRVVEVASGTSKDTWSIAPEIKNRNSEPACSIDRTMLDSQQQPNVNPPYPPEQTTYEWARFKEPPEDLMAKALTPILTSSEEPTFRAHDTPPDAEQQANHASNEAECFSTSLEDATLGSQQQHQTTEQELVSIPERTSRKASSTFFGTPIRSDLVMQETNWGEHVFTPTMNREIPSHKRSQSASPKKNTTPVSCTGTPTSHPKTTQQSVPTFDDQKDPFGKPVSLGQRIESAIDYVEKVKKAGTLKSYAPGPATLLQRRALEVHSLTLEGLKDQLRSMGERVSGPKRELVRRILFGEVKQGDLDAEPGIVEQRTVSTRTGPSLTPPLQTRNPNPTNAYTLFKTSEDERRGSAISPCPMKSINLQGSRLPRPSNTDDMEDVFQTPSTEIQPTKKLGRPPGKVVVKPRLETWTDPRRKMTANPDSAFSSLGQKGVAVCNVAIDSPLDFEPELLRAGGCIAGSDQNKDQSSIGERSEGKASRQIQKFAPKEITEDSSQRTQNKSSGDVGQQDAGEDTKVGTENETPAVESTGPGDITKPSDEMTVETMATGDEEMATLTSSAVSDAPGGAAMIRTLTPLSPGQLKRKRTRTVVDKDFRPSKPTTDSDQDSATEKPRKKRAVGKPLGSKKAIDTPGTKTNRTRAGNKRSSLSKELLALQVSGLDNEKNGKRGVKEQRDLRRTR